MLELFSIKHTLITINLGTDYNMSYIEAIGTIFGLLCIWYASMEKIISYPFGLINVTLFSIIFYQIQLYANLLLQIFFFAANIYGWYAWSRQTTAHEHVLKIRWLSKSKLVSISIIAIITTILLSIYIDVFFAFLTHLTAMILNSIGIEFIQAQLPPDAHPVLDAAITVLSIIAMLLMTRKYIENWLLWIVIDVMSIALYAQQSVYAMSLEYVILMVIALNGARHWIRQANHSHA